MSAAAAPEAAPAATAARPLKVALVFRNFNLGGSLERSVVFLARELVARGIEVSVYCNPETRGPAPPGVVFHDVVPIVHSSSRLGYPLECGSFALAATRALRGDRSRYDIIDVCGTAAWEQDVVTVNAVTKADQWRWPTEGGEHYRAARTRTLLAPALRPQIAVARTVERLQFRPGSFRRAVAVTETVRDDLIDVHGIAPELIDVIPYAIDVRCFASGGGSGEVRRQLGLPSEAHLLLFVGDSFRRKGLGEAIAALAGLGPDVHLVVVGAGERDAFAALATRSGVGDRVHFVGSTHEPERFYRDADVFVLPTRHEPWGIPLIEAMAAGVPVVTSAVAGAARVVAESRAGIVLDRPGPADVRQAAAALLADPARRAEMGANGRRAASRFDLGRHAEAKLESYRHAIAARNDPGAGERNAGAAATGTALVGRPDRVDASGRLRPASSALRVAVVAAVFFALSGAQGAAAAPPSTGELALTARVNSQPGGSSEPKVVVPSIQILSMRATKARTVRVRVAIRNWPIFERRRTPLPKTGGYWLIWVDGRLNAASRLAGSGTTTRLLPGLHHLWVELVRDNRAPLTPRARSRTVVVTIDTASAGFPLIAEYRAVNRASIAARFDLNVLDGHNAGLAAQIKAAAPSSLVFVTPNKRVGSSYWGWAATYGGYDKETGCTSLQTGPVRAYQPSDYYGVVYGEPTVNWGHAGTGVWSADVRACHAVVDDRILSRPVDGIWGDNHLWAVADVGLSGSAASAWDDGNAANVAELNRVLPGLLVGGNDVSRAFERGTYTGTVAGGDRLANFGMKESVQRSRRFYSSDGFDKVLSGIIAWNGLGGRRGEILNVNPGGATVPLTDAEKRVALAGAVISGAYLWLVDGPPDSNDWANTVVPGGTGSIPQMGQAPGYPRGYLGQPAAAAVHVGPGRWYRDFTSGYRVYANETSSPWTDAGPLVPPYDAVFAARAATSTSGIRAHTSG